MTVDQIRAQKQQARTTWATGDYPAIAEQIAGVGRWIVERVGVAAGDEVLDVACGDGNAAIPAASAGARVTGLDLTPELLEAGRRRSAEAGVELEWVEGDAEALPFADESFDVVLSVFGAMFAPRHRVAAEEIARVLRPGGRAGICSWTPDGLIGQFFRVVGGYAAPPPDFAEPPPLWGTEGHVRDLFEGTGIELEFERAVVRFRFDSVADAVNEYGTKFGPVLMVRGALDSDGGWEPLRDDLTAFFERWNAATDGTYVSDGEYLAVLGRKGR